MTVCVTPRMNAGAADSATLCLAALDPCCCMQIRKSGKTVHIVVPDATEFKRSYKL